MKAALRYCPKCGKRTFGKKCELHPNLGTLEVGKGYPIEQGLKAIYGAWIQTPEDDA